MEDMVAAGSDKGWNEPFDLADMIGQYLGVADADGINLVQLLEMADPHRRGDIRHTKIIAQDIMDIPAALTMLADQVGFT
jgi:hypothetical protein